MAINKTVKANLPHAGLGNMLLVWARAAVFAELNSIPMVAPTWESFHIGPYLRGERYKRFYGGFFSRDRYLSRLQYWITKLLRQPKIVCNPSISTNKVGNAALPGKHKESGLSQPICFVFDKMPPWNDYFQELKAHHLLVKDLLLQDLQPKLRSQVLARSAPHIAIHVRRGDFQEPKDSDDFAVRRYVYTNLDWYIDTLKAIRIAAQQDVPAMVFSDGYPKELAPLLELPNVTLSTDNSAISDLITLSRCKLLIGSSHSSFSAWATYLGQCPTIWPANRAHLYEPILAEESRSKIYEGGLNPKEELPTLLYQNIKDRLSQELIAVAN